MRAEDLFRSIGALDERVIDDSENMMDDGVRAEKVRRRIRAGALAACAAFALLLAAAGIGAFAGLADRKAGGELGKNFAHGKEPGTGYGDTQGTEKQSAEETETSQLAERQGTQTTDESAKRGPVRYSELQLAATPFDPEIAEAFSGAGAAACIKAFEESMLEDCAGMVEGVVTDIYIKTYRYQVEFDKFGEQGLMDVSHKSVVYEIAVDKTWDGDDRVGQTIKIEDSLVFADEMFGLKKGHRYVIPFVETGDTVYVQPDYVEGDEELKRDSVYSTLYEFQPQIEVTEDGCYVISKDWETLYAGDVREIVMDRELDESSLGYYYRDRMGLLSAEAFAERMEILLNR